MPMHLHLDPEVWRIMGVLQIDMLPERRLAGIACDDPLWGYKFIYMPAGEYPQTWPAQPAALPPERIPHRNLCQRSRRRDALRGWLPWLATLGGTVGVLALVALLEEW